MLRRFILIGITLIIPMMSSAQKMLTASGEYTYHAPQNITVEQAKSIAIESAKINIIADHFGTVVGVNNSTTVSNVNGESSVSFCKLPLFVPFPRFAFMKRKVHTERDVEGEPYTLWMVENYIDLLYLI